MARPTDADSAQTWERILQAARAILHEEVDARRLTLRSVAERAELSSGTLAYYFPTKNDLLEACLDEYHHALRELVVDLVSDVGDDRRAFIERAGRALFRFQCERRSILRLRVQCRMMVGELPANRQERSLGPLIAMGASALATSTGRSEDEIRFGLQSLTYLMTHFALCTSDERERVFGRVAGQDEVEEHLVRVALELLT